MTTAGRILRPYVVPLLTTVDLRAKSALAEDAMSKLSVFAAPPFPPPTSASNVEGGTVFGPGGPGSPPGRR